MNKKTVLLIIGLLIIAMGVLALLPGMSMGSEPMWHTIAKLVLGVVAVFIALKNEKAVGITTMIVGVVLVVMGLLGLIHESQYFQRSDLAFSGCSGCRFDRFDIGYTEVNFKIFAFVTETAFCFFEAVSVDL